MSKKNISIAIVGNKQLNATKHIDINSNNTSGNYTSPGAYLYFLKDRAAPNIKLGMGKLRIGGTYACVDDILCQKQYTIKYAGQRLMEPLYWFQIYSIRAEYLLKLYLHEYKTSVHSDTHSGEWFDIPKSLLKDLQNINWFTSEVAIWKPAKNEYFPSQAVLDNIRDFDLPYTESAAEKELNKVLVEA